MDILNRTVETSAPIIHPILSQEDIFAVQKAVNLIFIDKKIRKNIVDLVCATRNLKEYGFPELESWIEIGASPRATSGFVAAVRAAAFFAGRNYVSAQDVKSAAFPILRQPADSVV